MEVDKVSYQHWRVSKDYPNIRGKGSPPAMHLRRKHEMSRYECSPKGGRTVCSIRTNDGKWFFGQAWCSLSDNFCYKLGREIAYGRALKQMRGGNNNGIKN